MHTDGKLPKCENNTFEKRTIPSKRPGITEIHHFNLRLSSFIEVKNAEKNCPLNLLVDTSVETYYFPKTHKTNTISLM